MTNHTDFFDNRIPNSDFLKTEISMIEKLDLEHISYENLTILLEEIFPIIPLQTVTWTDEYYIFRARRNLNNEFQKPFNYITEIGIPEKANSYGRANSLDEPIFYGSHQGDLTLFECCQNVGQFDLQNFTMGIWKVKKNCKLNLVILKPTDEILEQRKDLIKISDIFNNSISDLKENEKEYSTIVTSFFSKQFTKSDIANENDYKISAYFTDYVRNIGKWSQLKFDGIIYPSVANKFRGENVAIFNSSLHKIEFNKALSLTCYNFNNNTGKLTKGIFCEGYLLGELIRWKKKYD